MRLREKLNKNQWIASLVTVIGIFLIAWLAACFYPATVDAAGDVHTLTCYDTRYNDGTLMVGYFEIDHGTPAMCICHEMDPPMEVGSSMSTVAVCTADNKKNELLRKVYYYGWKGPGDIGASYVETTLAGSVANGHDDNYYGYGQAFIQRIANLPAAPKGFAVYMISNGVASDQTLAYWDYEPTGFAKLKKVSANPEITEGNTCYSLAGAVYGIYSDAGCTKQETTLTTNEQGETETKELPAGTYYMKEITAPKGFKLDPETYTVEVKADTTQEIEVIEYPVWNSGEFRIVKRDVESGLSKPLGGATLDGTMYTVRFYEGYYSEEELPESPDRSWIMICTTKESEEGTEVCCSLGAEDMMEGDELYSIDGETILPLGTLTVEETGAPTGYKLTPVLYTNESDVTWTDYFLTQILQEDAEGVIAGGETVNAYESVIRGDLKLVKIEEKSHKRMSGIVFRITSVTTGETHYLITDENGQASTESSWVAHTNHSNQAESCNDGIWFGQLEDGTITEPDDSKGALPYDEYEIEEIACEGNQGYDLIPAFRVRVTEDLRVINLGTLTNEKPEEPDDSEKPSEPEKPKTTGEAKTSTVQSVKTGDAQNAGIPLLACILSCVAIVSCVMIMRIARR